MLHRLNKRTLEVLENILSFFVLLCLVAIFFFAAYPLMSFISFIGMIGAGFVAVFVEKEKDERIFH